MYQNLPSFLANTNYQNPSDELATVFQSAFATSQHCFTWLGERPERLSLFNDYMALRRRPSLSWLSVYPVDIETAGLDDPGRAIYVNPGGGIGHQCREFRQRFPDLPGRVVLQDLPHTIEEALETHGVENMAHDFFDEQPVKDAKFYFFRGVCHNHPDHKVKRLLEQTRNAMRQDSILLLDEWVLPEAGVNSYAASMDLTMMAAFAGMERTESHWRELLDEVGLKLVKIYVYNSAVSGRMEKTADGCQEVL
ncbi:hypothetical protein DL765_004180 [Monosporascus sp. GIB2]|nr:hypothetical protein DL765_004180 [Monosporascus sp. GIB2]